MAFVAFVAFVRELGSIDFRGFLLSLMSVAGLFEAEIWIDAAGECFLFAIKGLVKPPSPSFIRLHQEI